MANYAIGDIQACYQSFRSLLKQINFDPETDKLWLAGDIVNRGPDSLATLRYVCELGDACEIVLGNHDLHMLAVYHKTVAMKAKDNFDDVLNAPDVDSLMLWLQAQPLAREIKVNDQKYLLSHAGIPPIWGKNKALKLAAEVQDCLCGEDAIEFFENMYGNSPNQWDDALSGMERLRLITNYFTRMRFCNAQGKLELTAKSTPDNAPEGYSPWFEFENPKLNGYKILFGHWAALLGDTGTTQYFALDTGCVWGNCLSALRLEDQRWFSCEC